MKISWIAVLGLVLAAPVMAQETPPPADAPPADAAAPPAETPPPAPPADAAPAPAETPPPAPEASAAPAESTPAPAEEAPKAEPWKLYAGADYVKTWVSSTGAGNLGVQDYHGKMLRARVGKRVLDAIGVEFQYGLDFSDAAAGEIGVDRYYGLYLVPTATVFEVVELAVPVGYSRSAFNIANASATVQSVAYGFTAELPLTAISESMPNLRLTTGWMVYNQNGNARVAGANAGVRYDFELDSPGWGNPFSGIGHWYKTHMPSWLGGGGDEAPPAN